MTPLGQAEPPLAALMFCPTSRGVSKPSHSSASISTPVVDWNTSDENEAQVSVTAQLLAPPPLFCGPCDAIISSNRAFSDLLILCAW